MMRTDASLRQSEHGIALVLTLFALLLLTVIGLGMMFSTNMETMINANYRDKQVAVYASLSGLQEARDRLQLANPDIPVPTELPELDNAQVIYIINPKGGETIEPWNIANEYADTELCQENVLGLTGTVGVPCTELPEGDDWYQVVDNSSVSSAPWNLTTPLDVKWTRVMIKGNNMTTVDVNGDDDDSTIVCWDGTNQITTPAGYGPTCTPDGSIATLTLTNAGSGYTSQPDVDIDAPPAGGTQAEATVTYETVASGEIAAINVTTGGSGYTSAPQVVITGDGTGASAVATVIPTGNAVDSLAFTAGNKCYGSTPTISLTGGGGSGATATVTMGDQTCIASWTPSGSCKDRKNENGIVVSMVGGGGSGFAGSIHFEKGNPWAVDSYSITTSGSGYTSDPTSMTISGSPQCPGVTFTVNRGRKVTGVTLTNGGGGFTSAPSVTWGPGQGTGDGAPTVTATIGGTNPAAGQVSAITVSNAGTGYTTATITLSGGTGGSVATASATIGTITTITGITLDEEGAGYLTDPEVTISGGGGTGATATALIAKGPTYGRIFLVTTLAVTASGARAMSQMELASPVLGFAVAGALTLDGPEPDLLDMPNSNNYQILGADENSCGETEEEDHPAIGGYDDPNASPTTDSVDLIIDALPKPENYIGAGGEPSVVNVYESLGETMGTPTGLEAVIEAIKSVAVRYDSGHTLTDNEDGEENDPAIVWIDGDLTYGGDDGVGILLVTGHLRMNGSFSWKGLVFVIGEGTADFDGGGNGLITGSMLLAKIYNDDGDLLPSLGAAECDTDADGDADDPCTLEMDWNGGGGNGIHYDHCWADNMFDMVPFTPPPSTQPLKVLSIRTLP